MNMSKFIALLLVLLTMTAKAQTSEKAAVILTAGQSNTAGRCMNDMLPDYIKALGTDYEYCNWSYTNGSTRKSESEGVFRRFWPEMESAGKAGRFAYDAIREGLAEGFLRGEARSWRHQHRPHLQKFEGLPLEC